MPAPQLAQYLDPGEVPVVDVAPQPGLQGLGALLERRPGITLDLDQHGFGEVADRVHDARMDRRAIGQRGCQDVPVACTPAMQGFRICRKEDPGRGEAGLRCPLLDRRPPRRGEPGDVLPEPRLGDRARAGRQRQVGMWGQLVQPGQPVLTRALRRCLRARSLDGGHVRRERRLGTRRLGLALVGRPPVLEEQEHADAVHDQPVMVDVEHHPVVGQQRHVHGEQRRGGGREDSVRSLLAQLVSPLLLPPYGQAAQVVPGDAYVDGRRLNLTAVRSEGRTQRAMPGHHGLQRRLEPIEVPRALDLVIDVAGYVAYLDRVTAPDEEAPLQQGKRESRLPRGQFEMGEQLCLGLLDSGYQRRVNTLARALQAQIRSGCADAKAAVRDLLQQFGYRSHAGGTSTVAEPAASRSAASWAMVRSPSSSSMVTSTPVFSSTWYCTAIDCNDVMPSPTSRLVGLTSSTGSCSASATRSTSHSCNGGVSTAKNVCPASPIRVPGATRVTVLGQVAGGDAPRQAASRVANRGITGIAPFASSRAAASSSARAVRASSFHSPMPVTGCSRCPNATTSSTIPCSARAAWFNENPSWPRLVVSSPRRPSSRARNAVCSGVHTPASGATPPYPDSTRSPRSVSQRCHVAISVSSRNAS